MQIPYSQISLKLLIYSNQIIFVYVNPMIFVFWAYCVLWAGFNGYMKETCTWMLK